ncbi:hypothetical protein HanXRQr2_Chr14g0661441 [Helianthus annuus]|uniref:Uncharacterized protein n=1 Tax=Helianthus annuus TaxID=4232 RepID=A0A9K3H7L6_HELAN|nr:hypothetical protein HanXRQr2_Chr14g0661441 [Helianthus annuus]KAJ0841820.1 hypothetical protein HanPSC8_Chr14g0634681 [Helianthus annuus]
MLHLCRCARHVGRGGDATSVCCLRSPDRRLPLVLLALWCQSHLMSRQGCGASRIAVCGNCRCSRVSLFDEEIRKMRCQAASSSVVTVAVIQLLCIDRSVHWMRCEAASL